MTWFKRKSDPAPAETSQPQAAGFFSGENPPPAAAGKIKKAIDIAYERTFLRGHPSITNRDGSVVALDNNESSNFKAAYSRFGNNIPEGQLLWYSSFGFIGYQTMAMMSQHWLIDKACSMPARDAVRCGYEITITDGTEVKPEVFDEIRRLDGVMALDHNLEQFVRMGRIFGIRIAMFKVRSPDPEYYTKPFNLEGVTPGSYEGISQIDPYWITPELDAMAAADPTSINYYEPTWWCVNGIRIHRSHLVIFRTKEVPDVLKPSYFWGGKSVPQEIAERVYAAERTANEGPLLAMTKRLTVIHADLEKALMNFEEFCQKLDQWTQLRDSYGVKVVGLEEVIEQFDTGLADLDATIMTQFQLVAAAAGVPATKLLGTTPKGFNSTGEYEEASYHEELQSIQTHDLTRLVDRHHAILIRSEIVGKFGVSKPFETGTKWESLDTMTAKEAADVNKIKAETDAIYLDKGVLDGQDVRSKIVADPMSGYNGISDQLPDDMETEAPELDDEQDGPPEGGNADE